MKFRKEYQKYVLIVLAIVATGYFMKHLFFNKKKVVEGVNSSNTYYRIDFDSFTNVATTDTDTDDRLKQLLLVQFDSDDITSSDDGNNYVDIPTLNKKMKSNQDGLPSSNLDYSFNDTDDTIASFFDIINQSDVLKNDNNVRVVEKCNDMLEFFKLQAESAVNNINKDSAITAYNYARFIICNLNYRKNINIIVQTHAANLLIRMIDIDDKNELEFAENILYDRMNVLMLQDGTYDNNQNRSTSTHPQKNTAENVSRVWGYYNKNNIVAVRYAALAAANISISNLNNDSINSINNDAANINPSIFTDSEKQEIYNIVIQAYNKDNKINDALIVAAGIIYQRVYTLIKSKQSFFDPN